jgi:hypothetical protein
MNSALYQLHQTNESNGNMFARIYRAKANSQQNEEVALPIKRALVQVLRPILKY